MWPGPGAPMRAFTRWEQVAAFSIENPIPLANLRRAVNRLLPPAIRVLSAEEADPDFHPRFDAKAKTYEYRIVRAEVCSPFEWPFAHHYPYPLDEARMVGMRARVRGRARLHGLRGLGRTRRRRGVQGADGLFVRPGARRGRLVYRIRGSGFLKHMVRNVVGTLLEAGRGNIADVTVLPVKAGPTAPAKGLFLVNVEY